MSLLILPLKKNYFEEICSGLKVEEYRLVTPYWIRRIRDRWYDGILLTLGYPARDDVSRRLHRPWRGVREISLVHSHFGPEPVDVFAIRVN